MELSKEEKSFLWLKMEYTKRKKSEKNEDSIYQILHTDRQPSEEEFVSILNSLEYTNKKILKDQIKTPNGKYKEVVTSLKSKLPESFSGVKYSKLSAKSKRDEKEGKKSN